LTAGQLLQNLQQFKTRVRDGSNGRSSTTTSTSLSQLAIAVAKNYLNQGELEALNLIVSFYLDFGELQARSRRPMYMRDWIAKLDDFLRLSERDILDHAGTTSHDDALARAEREYEKWRTQQAALPSPVEEHFDEVVEEIKRLQSAPSPKSPEPRRRNRGKTGGRPQ